MYDITAYDKAQEETLTGELLDVERFDWREKRRRSMRLARLYEIAGYDLYARKVEDCATFLQFLVAKDGKKRLLGANFCQLRLCPMCTARRAASAAFKLSRVLDAVDREHSGAMYLFLTLTIRNISGDELGDAIGQLIRGWNKLMQHRQVARSIKGWFRAVEVTRKDKGYHPHIHAILAVEPSYFARKSGEYIDHAEWVRRWKMALNIDYEPSVRIQTAKARGECAAGCAAAVEAAKYAVKDSDYIDPRLDDEEAAQIVRDYTDALFRRRLTAFGGWLKDVARRLDADDLDSMNAATTDGIREDVAELIETYHWHFGVGDYILARREINPLKVVREGVNCD